MQPEAKDAAYLWDMLDAACAVQEFVASRSLSDYLTDRMLRGAVERHLEIVGEAASRVSRSFRAGHPEIPWQRIVAQQRAGPRVRRGRARASLEGSDDSHP